MYDRLRLLHAIVLTPYCHAAFHYEENPPIVREGWGVGLSRHCQQTEFAYSGLTLERAEAATHLAGPQASLRRDRRI